MRGELLIRMCGKLLFMPMLTSSLEGYSCLSFALLIIRKCFDLFTLPFALYSFFCSKCNGSLGLTAEIALQTGSRFIFICFMLLQESFKLLIIVPMPANQACLIFLSSAINSFCFTSNTVRQRRVQQDRQPVQSGGRQ